MERRAADPILPLPCSATNFFYRHIARLVHRAGQCSARSRSFRFLCNRFSAQAPRKRASPSRRCCWAGWHAVSSGSRILLRVGYRRLSIIGTSIFLIGAIPLALFGASADRTFVMVFVTLMGMGMDFDPRVCDRCANDGRALPGTATSMLQFSRSMGGTLGISVMGSRIERATRRQPKRLRFRRQPDLRLSTLPVQPRRRVGRAPRHADAIHLVFLIALTAAALGGSPPSSPRAKS